MTNPDFVITEPPESLAAKMRLAAELDKRPEGTPSLFDELMEERRRERVRELEEEGW